MDLRAFISKALTDIVGGIQDAQSATLPGTVVPDGIRSSYEAVEAGINELQAVDFEVTVRAEDVKGREAKLSVVAAVIGGGVKGESQTAGGHAATLRFRIPLRLPLSERDDQSEH